MGGSRNEAEPVLGARGGAASTQHPAPSTQRSCSCAGCPPQPLHKWGHRGKTPRGCWSLWVAGGFNPGGAKKIVPWGWPGVTSPRARCGGRLQREPANLSPLVTPKPGSAPQILPCPFLGQPQHPPGGVLVLGGRTQGARCQQGPAVVSEHPLRNEGGDTGTRGGCPASRFAPNTPQGEDSGQTDGHGRAQTDGHRQGPRCSPISSGTSPKISSAPPNAPGLILRGAERRGGGS